MEGKRWALIHVAVSIYKSRRERGPRGRVLGGSFQCGRRPRVALDPRRSRAGTAARWLPSNPRHRAAPSSSRGEDKVEGLALRGSDIGVPQVHHEDHAGTLLRGTWVGCKHGVRPCPCPTPAGEAGARPGVRVGGSTPGGCCSCTPGRASTQWHGREASAQCNPSKHRLLTGSPVHPAGGTGHGAPCQGSGRSEPKVSHHRAAGMVLSSPPPRSCISELCRELLLCYSSLPGPAAPRRAAGLMWEQQLLFSHSLHTLPA